MPENIILDEKNIERTLKRLAHEIIEKAPNGKDLLLIGIRTRGEPLARRIGGIISEITGVKITVAAIDFTLYRDDLAYLKEEVTIEPNDMVPDMVTGKRVVLVDDVLFTGRSVRATIDALLDWGRPESVQLAVLIDRGHREMPIRADFVGKNIPSSLHERVQVRVKEIDGRDEVAIIRDHRAAVMAGGNGK